MIFDVLFLITMVWAIVFGYVNGPIKVFLYILSLIAAIVGAMVFTPTTAQLLRETFVTESPYMPFLGLVLTFLTVLFLMRIISNLLTVNEEGYFNMGVQGIGSLLMGAMYSFFFSVFITFLIQAQSIDAEKLEQNSVFYRHIKAIPEYGKAFLKATTPFVDGFIDYINRSIKALNDGNARARRLADDPNAVVPDSIAGEDFTLPLDSNAIAVDTTNPAVIDPNSPVVVDTTQGGN